MNRIIVMPLKKLFNEVNPRRASDIIKITIKYVRLIGSLYYATSSRTDFFYVLMPFSRIWFFFYLKKEYPGKHDLG